MRELEDVAVGFHEACEASHVAYAFVGGFAVIAWGQPRSTMDLDALVLPPSDGVDAWVEALRGHRFDVEAWEAEAALRDGSHLTVFDPGSQFHVDVAFASSSAERDEIGHAETVPFHGADLRFASPEDTIAFKVLYGTPQDLKDARSVISRQWERLDRDHLDEVARRLDVAEAVDELITEVQAELGQGPPGL